MTILRWVATSALLLLTACSDPGAGVPVRGEVLRPGEAVEATNATGTIRITYASPRERKYEWDHQSRVVKMIPRDEPWMDELGLYDPAECWFRLCRVPRLVVTEAAHDFASEDQLRSFLAIENATVDWVYTDDGLAVGWARAPQREQIDVEVRQLTIRGQRPVRLEGSRGNQIRVLRTV